MKSGNLAHCFAILLLLMTGVSLYAQPIKRSNVARPDFEVTASIYPWEVHDEGITQILDNVTNIAGVNSVYLIAVMHQEHRPFNGDKLPGSFYFIHNPVRTEWDAEDSRAYFKPDMASYGKIKPLLSNQDWLNQTDWLKILLDSTHARGLRAGVEVSHTYIPVEVLNSHPEYKQVDINGKAVERPCTNNPDVREYLVSLYGDLAKNYDVDYIQTCMLLFSRSDDPREGTCFCSYCASKAKEQGFDMEAAKPILKDNPYAQPQRDQWLKFRRASTTEIYKLVTDRIHKENAAIDFRLNDLNDRSSGLTLEELKGNINSVHLSTHTEQKGYQNTDRRSRILTTQYYMGKDIPIIPGVPTRLLTNEKIVKSSVKISVEAGAKGVAVKHYDGSPFSLLRAFRNGIAESGVAGFTSIKGVEAESMELDGYTNGKYLLEQGVKTEKTGTAVTKFAEEPGTYDIVVYYVDGKDGQGKLSLAVAGKRKANWTLNKDNGCWQLQTVRNVKLKKGDEIKITGVANGSDLAMIDFIEFRKK